MTTEQWISFCLVFTPSIFGLGRLFFPTWDDFSDSLSYSLIPDIISAFQGRFVSDILGELRLFLFIVAGLLLAAGEKWAIEELWKIFSQ